MQHPLARFNERRVLPRCFNDLWRDLHDGLADSLNALKRPGWRQVASRLQEAL